MPPQAVSAGVPSTWYASGVLRRTCVPLPVGVHAHGQRSGVRLQSCDVCECVEPNVGSFGMRPGGVRAGAGAGGASVPQRLGQVTPGGVQARASAYLLRRCRGQRKCRTGGTPAPPTSRPDSGSGPERRRHRRPGNDGRTAGAAAEARPTRVRRGHVSHGGRGDEPFETIRRRWRIAVLSTCRAPTRGGSRKLGAVQPRAGRRAPGWPWTPALPRRTWRCRRGRASDGHPRRDGARTPPGLRRPSGS